MAIENRKQRRAEARREQKLQKERDAENSRRAREPRTKGLKKPRFARGQHVNFTRRSTVAFERVWKHANSVLNQFVWFWSWLWGYMENLPSMAMNTCWISLLYRSLLSYFTADSQSGNESTDGTLERDQERVQEDAMEQGYQEEVAVVSEGTLDKDEESVHEDAGEEDPPEGLVAIVSEGTPVVHRAHLEGEGDVQFPTPESDHIELEELDSESRLKKLHEHLAGLANTTGLVDTNAIQSEDSSKSVQVERQPEEPVSPSESDHTELEELELETKPEDPIQEVASTTSLAGTRVAAGADPVPAASRPKEPTRNTTARWRPRILPALPDLDRLFSPGRSRRALESETRFEDSPQGAASTTSSASKDVEEEVKVVKPGSETQKAPSEPNVGRPALPDLDQFFGPAARSWADYHEPRGDLSHDGEGVLAG